MIISDFLITNKELLEIFSVWKGYSSYCFGLQTQSMLWISALQPSILLFFWYSQNYCNNIWRFCIRVSAMKCSCNCDECIFSSSRIHWKFSEQLSYFSSLPSICMTLEPLRSVVYLTHDLFLHLGGPGTVDGKRRFNAGWQRSVFCAAEDPWWSHFKLYHSPDLPVHLRKQTYGNHCPGKFYE